MLGDTPACSPDRSHAAGPRSSWCPRRLPQPVLLVAAGGCRLWRGAHGAAGPLHTPGGRPPCSARRPALGSPQHLSTASPDTARTLTWRLHQLRTCRGPAKESLCWEQPGSAGSASPLLGQRTDPPTTHRTSPQGAAELSGNSRGPASGARMPCCTVSERRPPWGRGAQHRRFGG